MESLAPAGRWNKPKKTKVDGATRWSFKTSCCQTIYEWGYAERPTLCPYCNMAYWDKGWHEFKLFNLQDQLKQERKESVLLELFNVLHDYSRIMMVQALKGSTAWLKPEDFNLKARELAYRVYDHVLKGSWIQQSFGALIFRILKGVLYEDAGHDQNLSLERKERDDTRSFGDKLSTSKNLSKFLEYDVDLLTTKKYSAENPMTDELMLGVLEINEHVQANFGHQGSIQMLAGFHAKITKKPVGFFSLFAEEFGNQARTNVENATLIFMAYLKQIRDRNPEALDVFSSIAPEVSERKVSGLRSLVVAR